jgi:hypothetical protein
MMAETSKKGDDHSVVDVEASEMKYVDKDADVGLQFLAQSEKIEYTEDEAKRVKRKTDLHLLPIVGSPMKLTKGMATDWI